MGDCGLERTWGGQISRELILPSPWTRTSVLHSHEELALCCLSHPACGFLRQPEATETGGVFGAGGRRDVLTDCRT
jgi:hypothetical protein